MDRFSSQLKYMGASWKFEWCIEYGWWFWDFIKRRLWKQQPRNKVGDSRNSIEKNK